MTATPPTTSTHRNTPLLMLAQPEARRSLLWRAVDGIFAGHQLVESTSGEVDDKRAEHVLSARSLRLILYRPATSPVRAGGDRLCGDQARRPGCLCRAPPLCLHPPSPSTWLLSCFHALAPGTPAPRQLWWASLGRHSGSPTGLSRCCSWVRSRRRTLSRS